jgi:uncharacterized protein YqeY
MSLLVELNTRLKEAMKARRPEEVNVIRMIKSRITERQTSTSFKGEMDDVRIVEVIGTYVKQMSKALVEYDKLGDDAAEHSAGLRFEIAFLTPYLPTKLDEAATFELVSKIHAEEGLDDPRMMGKLIGAVMRNHRDEVDASLVRAAVEKILKG